MLVAFSANRRVPVPRLSTYGAPIFKKFENRRTRPGCSMITVRAPDIDKRSSTTNPVWHLEYLHLLWRAIDFRIENAVEHEPLGVIVVTPDRQNPSSRRDGARSAEAISPEDASRRRIWPQVGLWIQNWYIPRNVSGLSASKDAQLPKSVHDGSSVKSARY